MSGAEALVVIGIIANIVALIDFTGKAVSRINSFVGDARKVPALYRDVQSILLLVADTVRELDKQAKEGDLDEKRCHTVQPTIKRCEEELANLKALLEKTLPGDKDGRRDRLHKAITSLRKDKEVQDIVQSISKKIQLVAANYTISTSKSKRVSDAISSLSISNTQEHQTYFMVPIQWSDDFSGRKDELTELERRLESPDKLSRVALVGLGGMGKTRIAIEYARRFRKSGEVSVFWVHASSAGRMRKAYFDIANEAQIPGRQDTKIDIFTLVKNWLEDQKSGKWLLIVDNADDADLLYKHGGPRLADWLPRSESGSILMTTRSERVGISFATAANMIRLAGLNPEDSIVLVASKLPDDPSSAAGHADLAQELECIPLALVQAAAFISINGLTVSEYLDLYRANDSAKFELLSEDFEDEVRDIEIRNPIATTWAITFDRIRSQEPFAADILSLMSVLDAQAIPESLLSISDSPIKLKKALGSLRSYSLISFRRRAVDSHAHDDPTYDLHRLVGLTTRNWLNMNNSLDLWTNRAIKLLDSRYPDGEFDTRDVWLKYLSHAVTLLANEKISPDVSQSKIQREFLGVHLDCGNLPAVFSNQGLRGDHALDGDWCPNCTVSLLNNVSKSFATDGALTQAKLYAERALVVAAECLGKEHLGTLDSLDRYGFALFLASDYDKATEIFQKVYDARCSLQGRWSRNALGTLYSLATSKVAAATSEDMIAVTNEVTSLLVHHREVLGDNHLETLRAQTLVLALKLLPLENLTEGALQKVARSDADLDSIVELSRRVMGPEHPRTLDCLAVLGMRYYLIGQLEESETTFKYIYEARREQSVSNDPITLAAMLNLSFVYNRQNRQEKRKEILTELLTRQLEILGKDHKDTISTLASLVDYYETHHPNKVEAQKIVVKLQCQVLGDDAEVTQVSIAKLAFEEGRKEESKRLLLRLLRLHQWQGDVDHANALRSLSFWEHRFVEGHDQDASFREIFRFRTELLGASHSAFLSGVTWPDLGPQEGSADADGANCRNALEAVLRTVISLLNGVVQLLDDKALTTIGLYASALRDRKFYHQAQELWHAVLVRRLEILGEDHVHIQYARHGLSCIYAMMGDYSRSAEQEVLLMETYERSLGEDDAQTLSVTASLANSLQFLGDHAESCRLRRKVYNVRQRDLAHEHPDTQEIMMDLANSHRSLQQYDEATTLSLAVFHERTRLLGSRDPQTLSAARQASTCLYYAEKYAESEVLIRGALEILRDLYGDDHEEVLSAMADLAILHYLQNEHRKCAELEWQILDKKERIFGIRHARTVQAASSLVTTLKRLKEFAVAETLEVFLREETEVLPDQRREGTLDAGD